MHQLILLRHAKAVPASTKSSDHERSLTKEGKEAAEIMGSAMRRLGMIPDVILVSSAARTQETLAALDPWDEQPNIETLPELYMAGQTGIEEILRALPETARSVLLIGHNPALHAVARLLAGPATAKPEFAWLADSFPTTALAEFLVLTPWQRLNPAGTVLKHGIRPRDLASSL
jgi:phosphohistidine phosphatase